MVVEQSPVRAYLAQVTVQCYDLLSEDETRSRQNRLTEVDCGCAGICGSTCSEAMMRGLRVLSA